MYIGNIITDEKIKVSKLFNVVESIDKTIDSIPSLYVGLKNVKSLGLELNYLERKLDDLTFWTFSKQEKRVLFEEDLYYFIEHSFNGLIKDIEYKFLDCILTPQEELSEIFKNIEKCDNIITFVKDGMAYIFDQKTVFGVDLRQLEYMGRDKDKFYTTIKSWSNVFLEGERILIEYKNDLSMFNDEVKYLPILYSIRHYE